MFAKCMEGHLDLNIQIQTRQSNVLSGIESSEHSSMFHLGLATKHFLLSPFGIDNQITTRLGVWHAIYFAHGMEGGRGNLQVTTKA